MHRLPLLVLALAMVVVAACNRAEAVDAIPSMLPRTRALVQVPGRLAYVAGGQIWQWSDGASRALTKPGVRYEGPAWSPDGELLAASEVGDNHSDLILFDGDGNRIRALTNHWSHVSVRFSAWARKAAWSADGTRISYVSDLGQTDMSLWSVGPKGGDNRRLWTMGLGSGGLDWPSWSPDGRRVAFASYPSGLYAPPQIFVATMATGALVQLTELEGGAFDPAWSPSGATIAFAGRANGKTQIMTARVDGNGLQRISDGAHDRAPAWSPDGEEIAYLSLDGALFDVAAVRLSGSGVSEPRRLTRGQDVDAISGVSWARAPLTD